jgi:hypothetical protein
VLLSAKRSGNRRKFIARQPAARFAAGGLTTSEEQSMDFAHHALSEFHLAFTITSDYRFEILSGVSEKNEIWLGRKDSKTN